MYRVMDLVEEPFLDFRAVIADLTRASGDALFTGTTLSSLTEAITI